MDFHILYLVSVLGLGMVGQWIAWRLRLPAILVLLLFGFGFGYAWSLLPPDVATPDRLLGRDLFFAGVSLAVGVILFEGGMSLRFAELRETGRAVFGLVTVGILITWTLTAEAANLFLGLHPAVAVLIGALLVVSGPTVIVPLLRHIRPHRRVASTAKWEGIVNDPIGAILAVITFYAILSGLPEFTVMKAALDLTVFMGVGLAIGLLAGVVFLLLLRRFLIPDWLHNSSLLAGVVVALAGANAIRAESGLVAVTVFGIVMANQRRVEVRHMIEFKENLRVLLISCLFIVLASRLKLDDIVALGWGGAAFVATLILVVRPLATVAGTFGSKLTWRERAFLAWLHPRGIVAAAVSSVFALELAAHHGVDPDVVAEVERIVPITFLVICGTVAVYGLTAGPLARLLGVAEANPQGVLFAGASEPAREMAIAIKEAGVNVMMVDTNSRNITAARMNGLPTCLANISSQYVLEEIDFSGIGRLMAMTPNDEVNSLAAGEFIELFGRAEVYQLPSRAIEDQRQQKMSAERMSPQRTGRLLFNREAGFMRLAERFRAGAVVKKTTLSEEFTYDDFRRRHGASALLLFTLSESGRLRINTVSDPLNPQPGQTVFALIDGQHKDAERKEAERKGAERKADEQENAEPDGSE